MASRNRFALLDEEAAPSGPSILFAPSLLAGAVASEAALAPGVGAGLGGAARGAGAAAAAVDDDDDDLGLGPAPAPSAAAGSAVHSSGVAVSAAAGPGAGAPPAAAAAGRSAALDLASIANEILAESKALPAGGSGAAAWDFSSFGATAETSVAEERQRAAREVEERQLAHEARIAALASDQSLLKERLARADHLARGSKKRKVESAGRGEDFGGRLESKVFKRTQSAKRRNQAKGMW